MNNKLSLNKNEEHVDHPKHYNKHPSGVECIDIIEHFPTNIGMSMKHMWRAGEKVFEGSIAT